MDLPPYVTVSMEDSKGPEVLRRVAEPLSFPLEAQDLQDIQTLETKFDGEGNCSGLAAPQIGISKQVIIFAAPENPDLKKFRADFTQSMDKTIWINPTYCGIGTEMHADYEACFSVENSAGLVKRYSKIKYEAIIPSGEKVEGEAEGFLARIIQHEIDHLKGILFTDIAEKGTIMSVDEYRQMRADAMAREEA